MAKTNVPRGRTRQSRRLNPDAVEEADTATSEDQAKDEAKDEPEDDKPQTEVAKNENEPTEQQETGDAAVNQAESTSPDVKTEEEDKPETKDVKGESDCTDLKSETADVQDKSDSVDDKTVEEKPVPVNTDENQAEETSSDVQADTEVPLKEEEMEDRGDAEVNAVIEVKGNAPTVSVSWETNEQQDQEMTGAQDLTKTDCTEISDVSEEEKVSPPEVVVVEESEEAHAEVKEDDEMEETTDKDTEETEGREEAEEKGASDGGESETIKKAVKRKQKAKSSVESSPSKKTKLINDGYCVYVGNLNNSRFYEDIKSALANYLMTQSLLVQDIRLDKAKKHAFVDLASAMDLSKALTLDGEKLLDKPMKVARAKVKNADKVKVKDPQKVKQAKNERSIFVENIPISASREDVLKVFPKATAVRFLGGTQSPSKGIAFVEFQYKEQATAALKLSGKAKIQERVLRVNMVRDKPNAGKTKSNSNNTKSSPSDTLYVSNLPGKVEEKHIKKLFKNAVQINIPQTDGKPRGYAFVQFASVEHANMALESAKNIKIMNRLLKVQFGLKSKTEETKVPSKSLIVLGLDQRTTANTLKEAFEGALSSRIFVDKDTGLSRKFGFVDFASTESCRKAIESMEFVEIDGCKVTVAFARPKHSEGADSGEKGNHKGGKAHKKGKGRGAGRPLPKKSKKVGN